jgi:hypothetical protein
MTSVALNQMLLGGIAVASLVAALFFVRYWRSTRDRFFLLFALSFGIEALNRIAIGLTQSWSEDAPLHYIVRVLSYGLILVAVWDKNRPRGK